ncbi:MAG: lytic transglycosylase domain-containing protein [Nocardioides sp.]|nr:lytic transglycosylase domain-containing protein [Nocardioides sp.]
MVRFGRTQKAAALLPLAVLSAAWTAGLVTNGSQASASGDSQTLPDGTRVPAHAVHTPASLTARRTLGPGIAGHRHEILATASASGIPAVALAAYQRAATIIDSVDHSCRMPWQLVAAIGRVESDHGRVDGNVLTSRGLEKPGVFGPVLDGRHGTTLIKDTDAGRYDGDTAYDRAVGPMQFIPSTWAIVGVDADNDGQRNPQDIYDASLASAVYLCSGPDDLSTTAGQRAAVYRYNHSGRYVDLVLAIEHAYQRGDYAAVPDGTTTTGDFSFAAPPTHAAHQRHSHPRSRGHHVPSTPAPTPTPTSPTSGPTAGPTTPPSTGPSSSPTSSPTGLLPTKLPTSLPTSLPTKVPTSLPTILTKAQAIARCLAKGLIDNPLDPNDAFDRCVYKLTH